MDRRLEKMEDRLSRVESIEQKLDRIEIAERILLKRLENLSGDVQSQRRMFNEFGEMLGSTVLDHSEPTKMLLRLLTMLARNKVQTNLVGDAKAKLVESLKTLLYESLKEDGSVNNESVNQNDVFNVVQSVLRNNNEIVHQEFQEDYSSNTAINYNNMQTIQEEEIVNHEDQVEEHSNHKSSDDFEIIRKEEMGQTTMRVSTVNNDFNKITSSTPYVTTRNDHKLTFNCFSDLSDGSTVIERSSSSEVTSDENTVIQNRNSTSKEESEKSGPPKNWFLFERNRRRQSKSFTSNTTLEIETMDAQKKTVGGSKNSIISRTTNLTLNDTSMTIPGSDDSNLDISRFDRTASNTSLRKLKRVNYKKA